MENSRSNNLGVNKAGKNIRKNHSQENNSDAFLPSTRRRQQHDDVIHIVSKEDFKDFVQMHTGSHSHHQPSRPVSDPPNRRLNAMRPPPLQHVQRSSPMLETPSQVPYNNHVSLQAGPQPFVQASSSSSLLQPMAPRNPAWGNPVESPTSAYKRYAENSTIDLSSWGWGGIQAQPHSQPHGPSNVHHHHHHPPSSSWVSVLPSSTSNDPTLPMHAATNPQVPNMSDGIAPTMNNVNTHPGVNNMYFASNPPVTVSVAATHPTVATMGVAGTHPLNVVAHDPPVATMGVAGTHPLNVVAHDPPPVPSYVSDPFVPNVPSTETNGPPMLPSPTSEFLLSSPTSYINLESPQSYYPPLSPGMQFPFSVADFPLSPNSQAWSLEPLFSPGQFPPSPSEFPLIPSPRTGDQQPYQFESHDHNTKGANN